MAEEVGILLTLKDAASKAIKGVSGALKAARTAVNQFGSSGVSALGAVAKGAALLNQGLELGKKAMGIFRETIGLTIESALQFRKAGDPMIDFFEQANRQSDLLKARIGDALLPVIKGFSDASGGLVKRLTDWIAANQKLIASGIVDFITSMGNGVVRVIKNMGPLVKVIGGVMQAFNFVKAAVNAFFGAFSKGLAVVLRGAAKLQSILGFDGIAGSLNDAAEVAEGFGKASFEAADEAVDAMMVLQEQVDSTADSVESFGKTAERVWRKTTAGAIAEARKATTGLNETTEEQEQKSKAAAERQLALGTASMDAMLAVGKARSEAARALADQQAALAEQTSAMWEETGRQMAEQIGTAVGVAIVEGKKLDEVFKEVFKSVAATVLQTAQQTIMANAAASAAAAAPGTAAASGPAAPIVVPAVIAAVFGIVAALVQKLATGGLVQGGVPGRDSVLIAAMPGERVLNRNEARMMEQRQGQMSQGGPTSVTFAPSLQTFNTPTREERRRFLKEWARDFERAVDDGVLLRNIRAGARA